MARLPISSIKALAPDDVRGSELLELVRWQVSFGPRYPGASGHRQFTRALAEYMAARVAAVHEQHFRIPLLGQQVDCVNLVAHIPAAPPVAQEPGAAVVPVRPLLLGTHFDSRLLADNEREPALRQHPIPGANDGGSGTAILLHLLGLCRGLKFNRDLLFVLFDAEDIGNIDHHPFSVGARYFAEQPLPFPPEEVLILDMVGGKNMILDVDAHTCLHPPSRRLAERLFRLAEDTGYLPLLHDKDRKLKYIVCDHIPFIERNLASFILIDIDYPEWHTQRDLPDALSPASLVSTENFLLALLGEYVLDE
jgi:hypothetical protein